MSSSTVPAQTPWIPGLAPNASARLRLFCFPYAGIGVSSYRTWKAALPGVDICPVQLPGRESRHNESPLSRMEALVDAAADGLRPYMDVPFAFFGHSMGALVAYELARAIDDPNLKHLFVSARRAPHIADPFPAITALPSAEFVAKIQQRYGGIPAAVLAAEDLLELLLPRLRADFEVLENYTYRPGRRLTCDISVFGGNQDTVTEADLRAWQEHTTGAVRVRMLDAGHLYLDSQRDALLRAVAADLGFDRNTEEAAW